MSHQLALVRLGPLQGSFASRPVEGTGLGVVDRATDQLVTREVGLLDEAGFLTVSMCDLGPFEATGHLSVQAGDHVLLVSEGPEALGVWNEIRSSRIGRLAQQDAQALLGRMTGTEQLVVTVLTVWQEAAGSPVELELMIGPAALPVIGEAPPRRSRVPRWAWVVMAGLAVALGLVVADVVQNLSDRADSADVPELLSTLDEQISTANTEMTTTNELLSEALASMQEIEQKLEDPAAGGG